MYIKLSSPTHKYVMLKAYCLIFIAILYAVITVVVDHIKQHSVLCKRTCIIRCSRYEPRPLKLTLSTLPLTWNILWNEGIIYQCSVPRPLAQYIVTVP